MAHIETVSYICEKCGKKLKARDPIDIMTELKRGAGWSRLHVYIIHKYGMHNDGKEEHAELCKTCTLGILTDAVKRIRAGERATAGTESSEQEKWS